MAFIGRALRRDQVALRPASRVSHPAEFRKSENADGAVGFAMAHCRSPALGAALVSVHLERGDERLLRDVDAAEAPHLLLSRLLLVEQLALARDISAIAFGGDVLAHRADR